MNKTLLRGLGGLLAPTIFLSACVTQPPLMARSPGEAASAAPARSTSVPADGLVPVGTTRVRLAASSYPPGFDQLRVVRRADAQRAVAAQVAASIAGSALARGPVVADPSYFKDMLRGEPVQELSRESWAANPGMKELPEALSEVATRIFAESARRELERGRKEGWSREDMQAAAQVQPEANAPLAPGLWQLGYDTLKGNEEAYRLQFSASLGLASVHFGIPPIPAHCLYQSEPLVWADWTANGWQRLRDERAAATAQCFGVLTGTRADLW